MADIDESTTDVEESTNLADQLELGPEEADETTPRTDKTEPAEVDNAEKPTETTGEDTTETGEAKPEATAETTTEEKPPEQSDGVDLKAMSRAERAEYFQNLSKQTGRTVEQAINQAYQPQAQDELTQAYMEQGYDEFQAQILARETRRDQQAQINEARAEIAELNAGMATEAMEVVSSIDWLNPKSESFDRESMDAASKLYEQLGVVRDPNSNQIVEARMSPATFYNLMDTIRKAGNETAKLQAQKDAEQQLASVAPSASTKPPANKSAEDKQADDLGAAFDRI